MKVNIILSLFFFLMIQCGRNTQLNSEITNIIGKKITIDTLNLFTYNDISSKNILEKKLKLLVYSDSTECSICKMRLPEWKIKIRELDKYKSDVSVFFIVNSKDIATIEMNLNFIGFKNIVLYDTLNIFKTQNVLSSNNLLHTFLLDKDNKILIVGNPLERDKLWDLYKNTIKEKIQKNE